MELVGYRSKFIIPHHYDRNVEDFVYIFLTSDV